MSLQRVGVCGVEGTAANLPTCVGRYAVDYEGNFIYVY